MLVCCLDGQSVRIEDAKKKIGLLERKKRIDLKPLVADIDIVNIRRVREMIKTSNQNANQHHEKKVKKKLKMSQEKLRSAQVCRRKKKMISNKGINK